MSTADRGFASMDDAKKKEIQSMGGKASGSKSKSTNTASKKTSGGLDQSARSRGGKNSHR